MIRDLQVDFMEGGLVMLSALDLNGQRVYYSIYYRDAGQQFAQEVERALDLFERCNQAQREVLRGPYVDDNWAQIVQQANPWWNGNNQ